MSSTSSSPSKPDVSDPKSESQDRIVKSIYDHLITSVCIDVACNMHGLIKTGEFSFSQFKEPFSRHDIYPELYKDMDPAAIQAELDKFATDMPVTMVGGRKRSFRQATAKDADDSDDNLSTTSVDNDEKEVPAAPTMQTRHTINHSDIWGRIPPKEPKQTCECQLCGRHVSTLRFAPHLDKCMGLSTRPAAAAGNGQRNNNNNNNA